MATLKKDFIVKAKTVHFTGYGDYTFYPSPKVMTAQMRLILKNPKNAQKRYTEYTLASEAYRKLFSIWKKQKERSFDEYERAQFDTVLTPKSNISTYRQKELQHA